MAGNHHHDIYLNYYRLGNSAFREKVRFYEENPSAIALLPYDERIEIDIDYVLCLFEIGRYQRYLEKVDPVIETVIEDNIFEYQGENIFNILLLRKAASLYHTHNFEKCETVTSQLLRLDPQSAPAKKLYSLCNRRKENNLTTFLKIVGMSGLIIVISITFVRILLIEPFYDQYLSPFIIIRNVILIISVASLLSIEVFHQYQFFKNTGKFSSSFLNLFLRLFPNKK